MNTLEKKAYKTLLELGYRVEKPIKTKFQRNDFFGLFDFIAINKSEIRLIQVSKKYFGERSREYKERFEEFPCPENCTKEYWRYNTIKRRFEIIIMR